MSSLQGNRPPVPAAVKRALRQEAGFGCCICGFPLYDYHHIVPYERGVHFRVADMMLLCPNHHREATLGGLPESEQRRNKASPHNRHRGFADGSLQVLQPGLAVNMGSNYIFGEGTFIEVDDSPLLQLHTGPNRTLELSVALYDQRDNLLALIERNQWIVGDPLPWDFEFGLKRLTIRERSGLLSLTLDARRFPVAVTANLWHKGQHFQVGGSRGLVFNGVVKDNIVRGGGFVGIKFKADTHRKALIIEPNTPNAGAVVGGETEEEQVENGVRAWNRLQHPTWPWASPGLGPLSS